MTFHDSVSYITETLQHILSNNNAAQIENVTNSILKAKKVFVFFNNCHQGQAVRDAKRMIKLLGIE